MWTVILIPADIAVDIKQFQTRHICATFIIVGIGSPSSNHGPNCFIVYALRKGMTATLLLPTIRNGKADWVFNFCFTSV